MKYNFLAACMMHVEGYYSIKSLAFKNNNPGNIEESDGIYRRYDTKIDGYTALVNDIQANIGKPLNTFIAKYAPPNENNTSAYLQEVCILTGMNPTDIL